MNEAQQLVMVGSLAFLALACLGKLALHFSARRKFHQKLEQDGATITRIRRFNGFLDLGSFWEAATSEGHIVNIVASGGVESKLYCLVRYVPVLGIARSVEIMFDDSIHA